MKLSTYCCERRLAAVYVEEFIWEYLSDMLLDDAFGWDDRIRVAIQLADLLAWLHERRIAVGSITASCIIVNAEMNIKVFDFGAVYHHVNEDSEIPPLYPVGRDAPEVFNRGKRTMKSDVYIFGLLLMELIAKKEFVFRYSQYEPVVDEVMFGRTHLVHKCFDEVDDQTASDITELTCRCLDVHPDKRPSIKSVFDALGKLRKVGEERK
ncbi:salt tolerance receptor-like cytoplasmic kinase 1 [Nicotiana tabacum]|uniref:Salt tolerance receptor-like cytoplasmic kinase 1 n=1 Tax=Nicotiana tabacum TaxID=4097 RepID=A0AC58S0B0_TOBAC